MVDRRPTVEVRSLGQPVGATPRLDNRDYVAWFHGLKEALDTIERDWSSQKHIILSLCDHETQVTMQREQIEAEIERRRGRKS